MERLLFALVVLFLLTCAVTTAVLSRTVDRVATAVIEEQAKTDPMDSLLAYSGVPEQRTSPLVYVALVLLPLVFIGAVILYMRHSTELSKERRRGRRNPGGGHVPTQSQLPPTQLPPLPPRMPLPPPTRPGERTW